MTATRRAHPGSKPMEGPSFLTMIGFVAILVATVIVVFFGIGYLLGRLFV